MYEYEQTEGGVRRIQSFLKSFVGQNNFCKLSFAPEYHCYLHQTVAASFITVIMKFHKE